MLDLLKKTVLFIFYFMVYQVAISLLMSPYFISQRKGIATSHIIGASWFSSLIGFGLLLGLSLYLWKLVNGQSSLQMDLGHVWYNKPYWPFLAYILFFLLQLVFPIGNSDNQSIILEMIDLFPVQAFLLVVVFAGLIEELLFRGIIATYFFSEQNRSLSIGFYGFMTGSLFSLIHGPENITVFLYYFTHGLILAWLYVIKKDIRYPIALHIFNNALVYFSVVFS
ncbi:TPA: CPBP family intramembrane metalloprotease [Streptococcus suis]|nr:CPBP family intramembrane metalloprotease [Streptococcus suis]